MPCPRSRNRADVDAVGHAALETLAVEAIRTGASVHAPRFGAGLAGGDRTRIEHLIRAHLVLARVPVTIYDLP